MKLIVASQNLKMQYHNLKIRLTTLCILLTLMCYAQEMPPPPSKPTKENETLINKLIQVTDYEKYMNEYCITKISKFAREHNWTEDKKGSIIQSIKFKYFDGTIYNVLSFYSTDDLKDLISVFERFNKNRKYDNLIIINGMIQSNLDLFVESVIDGKYL